MQKPARRKTGKILVKGQIWKAKDKHIQIVELGEMIHYRMQHKAGPMRKVQTTLPETMQDYLKAHGALLVNALPEAGAKQPAPE